MIPVAIVEVTTGMNTASAVEPDQPDLAVERDRHEQAPSEIEIGTNSTV